MNVNRRAVLVLTGCLAFVPYISANYTDYVSAKNKFDMIQSDRLKPGERLTLSPRELNAWVEQEAKKAVPVGLRNPAIQLGNETATGTAMVDFGKLRRAQGQEPGWLMSRLLDGERPVKVTARLRSSNGRAVVDVQRVEISGLVVEGRLLDYLIQNYLLPRYPEAKIGQPFQLGHNVERIDVKPSAVAVFIGK